MSVARRFIARSSVVRPDLGERLCAALDAFVDGDGFGSAGPAVRSIVAEFKARVRLKSASANRWSFVMIDVIRYGRVVEYLAANSRRPMVAVRFWANVFCHLTDDGEVVASRSELAAELGVRPGEVSEVISELCRVNAMSRERKGATVRYFMSPWLGTHLSGRARDDAQRLVPDLNLVPKVKAVSGMRVAEPVGSDPVRRRWPGPLGDLV